MGFGYLRNRDESKKMVWYKFGVGVVLEAIGFSQPFLGPTSAEQNVKM